MRSLLQAVVQIGQELLDAEEDSPPSPKVPPEERREQLDLELGQVGLPEEEVVEHLRDLVHASPHTSDVRFVNQLFAGRIPIATAAEMLTALMNHSMYTYKAAGPQVLLENEVIRQMCQHAGFPDGEGSAVPGGSMANLIGMMLGRQRAIPSTKNEGSDGRKQRFYLSRDGHYSVPKNASMMGAGRDSVVSIPCDDLGQMIPEKLAEAIAQDLSQGMVPCAVIATAGTTVLGAFDPLDAIADVCARHKVWLHVDGAFGGSILMHPPSRHKMKGLERADSLTWDAHKAMGVPLSSSFVLTRKSGVLHELLSEDASYLFQTDDEDLNPGVRSMQCGRRNDALKLWAAWKMLGDEGWAARVEQQLKLAQYAVQRIQREERLQLTQDPAFLTICFEVEGISSPWICDRLQDQGLATLGYGIVRGRKVLRLVTVNPETTPQELDRLFDDILRVSALPAAEPVGADIL